jgi:hypothetical protein
MFKPRKNNGKTKSLGHQNISTFSFQLICLFRFSKLFCFAQKLDFILMMLTESSFISMFALSWEILQFLITLTTKKVSSEGYFTHFYGLPYLMPLFLIRVNHQNTNSKTELASNNSFSNCLSFESDFLKFVL